jgi:hypothetical protein
MHAYQQSSATGLSLGSFRGGGTCSANMVMNSDDFRVIPIWPKVRQYPAGEDVGKQCLAGTCAIPTPREFTVERIGEVLAVGMAERGRAASIDTTAA